MFNSGIQSAWDRRILVSDFRISICKTTHILPRVLHRVQDRQRACVLAPLCTMFFVKEKHNIMLQQCLASGKLCKGRWFKEATQGSSLRCRH